MPDTTNNFGFLLPLGNEDFDIGHQNANWIEIDDLIQAQGGSLVGGNRYDTANTTLKTLTNNSFEQTTNMETPVLALQAGLAYKISAVVEYGSTNTSDRLLFRIRATDLAGLQYASCQEPPVAATAQRQHAYIEGLYIATSGGFSGKFIVSAQRMNSTGGVPVIYKSDTTKPHVKVERLGPASGLVAI